MEYPELGELLKDFRYRRGKTIYEVAEYVGVSHTYISQIENGRKLPSKKVFFPLAYFLVQKNTTNHNLNPKDKKTSEFNLDLAYAEYQNVEMLLINYSDYQKINKLKLEEEYFQYVTDKLIKNYKESQEILDASRANRVLINKNTGSTDVVEEPYLDLEWLLTQKEYSVFYGRDYDTLEDAEISKHPATDHNFSSILKNEDLKIIHSIIDAYISSKYNKIN